MVYCYVPFCYSESAKRAKGQNKECRDENRVSVFAPPKDEVLLNTWKIKIGRVDRQLTSKDKVFVFRVFF